MKTSEPRFIELIWATIVCGLLSPFGWLVRCQCCWRGHCRTVIHQHDGQLRLLRVCSVCHDAWPVAAWLQPPHRQGNAA